MFSPLRFRPHLRPMVWGGRSLGEVLGKSLPSSDTYGESWEISDHSSHRSVVAAGDDAGLTLRDLLRRDAEGLTGSPVVETFPWLVKFLDAADWLSVQVHPDEESVARLWPGEGSKTEAWFVLAARPGSRVYAGLQPGVDCRVLREAVERGTAAGCLHSFEPRAGDCLFLPAGTVHAVGGGVLIAEIQQTSDATFRLFDWNRVDAQGRGRALHVEQGMSCIDWTQGPVHPVRAAGYPQGGHPEEQGPVRQPLVRCSYFHLDYVRQREPFAVAGAGRMEALMVVHGRAVVRPTGGEQRLVRGDTLLLPAALDRTWIQPDGEVGVLLASLPPEGQRAPRVLNLVTPRG